MPPQVNFDFQIGGHKEKRRQEWDRLVEQHPGLASTAEDYNAGLDNYIKTGQIPTRTQETRVDTSPQVDSTTPEGVPLTTFPDTEVTPPRPIQLDPTFSLNKTTGDAVPMDGVPGRAKVYEYDPTKTEPKVAQLHVIDPLSGKQVAVYPFKGDKDSTVMLQIDPAARAAARPPLSTMTPEQRADLDTMKKYTDAVQAGDVPQQLEDMAIGSAGRLNLPVDIEQLQDTVKDPNWFAGMFGAKPETVPGGRKVRIGGGNGGESPDAGAPPAGNAPAAKPLTADLAKSFLKQAGGDRNKARQLAKTAGYTF